MPKTDISVGELIDMIARGDLRLPQMQRKYVWTATRVRDLFDSLYRGYPSGGILVWETGQDQPAKDLSVEQSHTLFTTSKLLLDGQQRLTSLSAVIRGTPLTVRNRRKQIEIAFNLDHPEEAPEDITEVEDDVGADSPADGDLSAEDVGEESDEELSRPSVQEQLQKRTFVVASKALMSSPSWVLVSDIFKAEKSDWQLLKRLISSPDDPRYDAYTKRLQRVRKIKDYQYVMQILPRDLSYEEVAEIFVRVNSLGVKLRGSDLALASITAKWPESLAELEAFIDECEKESHYTLDLGLLVRALVVFATNQSRFKTVASLSRRELEAAWEQARDGLSYAINYLRTNAGVEDEILLSSPFFMIPLAYLGVSRGTQLPCSLSGELLRWLFLANARGHYSGQSETTLDADLSAMRKDSPTGILLDSLEKQFGRLRIEASDFVGRGERNALFALAYLACKYSGAEDWDTELGLSLGHQGQRYFLQYHHIFPKSRLKEAGFDKYETNEIANFAFINGRTNRRISNKLPAQYLSDVVEAKGEGTLRRQAIPTDPNLWALERYRDFLDERRKLLAERINSFIDLAAKNGAVGSVTI